MTDLSRRDFLRASAGGGLAAAVPALPRRTGRAAERRAEDIELQEVTVADLQAHMQAGRTTAAALCAAYVQRIEAIDRAGPTLRSVIEINPEAITIAEQLDAERKRGSARGPLHGIPVLIKDNIATHDRMSTTAGSLALDGVIAPRDSFLVRRLRAAGAVILGKTNLSEWANFRSTQSSSGWSGRGGQCKNPYALDRSPCGSSSGTGAAIAASLATVGIGTETDGSIVCPSNANALVGLKPTVGLVSRSGIIPISHTQDTAGPMCRTVTDAAILLSAIAGSDPEDGATERRNGGTAVAVDYTTFLDPNGLRGARIGVARKQFWGYSPETDRLCEAALQALRDAGAIIIDPADIPHAGEYDGAEWQVLLYEFKADLNAYLRDWAPSAPAKTLADLIAFNERERAREMPYFGQEIFELAEAKGPLTEQEYVEALATCGRLSRPEGIDQVMDEHRLDAIVAPTGSPPWPIDLVNGDHFIGSSSTPGAVSGYPQLSVPVGYSFGLPVGLTFLGRPWSEGALLKLAYGLEQLTQPRQ
ncbi:MAG: amidase, partial [Gemmatimonadota bacterium]|nr:amidase [Gemmatimonadota bacterium]